MGRQGNLRASDADREEVVDRLHTAAVEGRLAAEELDERVRAALIAVTYADLDATVRDLPSPRHRAPGSAPRTRRATSPNRGRRTAGGVALAALRANPLLIVFLIPLVAVAGAMLIAASAVWGVFMILLLMLGARGHHPFGSRGGGPWSLVWDREDRGRHRRW